MNGRKARALRALAVARATKPGHLGYRERKIEYQSVDRHGKPVTKTLTRMQLMYQPMSWRPIYQRLKREYARNPKLRAQFVGL